MNEAAFDALTKARAQLIIDEPFIGELSLRLLLAEEPDIPTMGVDGRNYFYNPEFVLRHPPAEIRTLVAHEVFHCVLDHIGRRGARDPQKWNIAADYADNEMLDKAGFAHVATWLRDEQYDGMGVEQIYNLLPDRPSPGSGSALCEIRNAPVDEAEATLLSNDWKIATIQAASAAQQQGKLPANLKRFVDELVAAHVNWREQLRLYITERSKDDFTWMRPNRRYLPLGLILPSMYSETMGEICLVVDTSGSIDDAMLQVFTSEVRAIRDAVHPRLTRVIYCDAKVQHVDEFLAEDELKTQMYGGGGTDFRPPFRYLDEQNLHPACLVYLTDMKGRFPDTPPEYPVIWCATTKKVGPWGRTIAIEA